MPLRDRALDLDALLEAARRPRTRLIYVANPNNPTGTLLARDEVRRFLDELPEGVLCVLDEAYAEYADEEPEGPALVREGHGRAVRAAHVLEGLRAGGAARRLRARLARGGRRARPRAAGLQRQPAGAGGGGGVAARARGGRPSGWRTPARARALLFDALADAGLDPIPSQTNFVYADVPGGDAEGLARALLGARASSCARCPASARRARSG